MGNQVTEMMAHKIFEIEKVAEANAGKVVVTNKTTLDIQGKSASIVTDLSVSPPKITDHIKDTLEDDDQEEMPGITDEAAEQGRKTQVEQSAKKKKAAKKKAPKRKPESEPAAQEGSED